MTSQPCPHTCDDGELAPTPAPWVPDPPLHGADRRHVSHPEPEPASLEPTLPRSVSARRPAGVGEPRGWGSPASAGRGWGSVWRPDGGISADGTLGVRDKPWSGGLLAGRLLDPQAPSRGGSGPLVSPSSGSLLLVWGSGLARGELGSWVPSDLWGGGGDTGVERARSPPVSCGRVWGVGPPSPLLRLSCL